MRTVHPTAESRPVFLCLISSTDAAGANAARPAPARFSCASSGCLSCGLRPSAASGLGLSPCACARPAARVQSSGDSRPRQRMARGGRSE
ncbi:hypothetical protein PSEUDO8AS_70044 [Pseudomonas sp. 8AS]|nr:hypothetical protein PSEUDO8AS_70044 [Pseudomonas sp. 8AS]